jgi:hypothetical protein
VTEQTLKRLIAVLVAAIVVWVAAVSLSSDGDGPIVATGAITEFFDGVDSSSATAVRFIGSEQAIELRTDGGVWTANGHASDTLMVSRLLRTFTQAGAGDLAGTNPSNHDRMGVSADSAVTLEIDVAGETRTLLVGKAGARAGRVYARLPGQDDVYLLQADIRAPAIRRLEDWRNKGMISADTSRVARIEVERDGDSYTLIRGGEGEWTFEEDGGEAQPSAVRGVLSELARLIASGFLEESDSVAVLERGGSTVAYSETGELLARLEIGSGENDRWARLPDDPAVYRLPAFRIDRITPKLEAVRPDA